MKYSNIKYVIVVVGLACGMFTLEAAYEAQPPFDWSSVVFSFIAILFGMPFVIGIQLLRNNPKFAKYAVAVFRPISIFVFSSGVSAFAIELSPKGITPQGMFFMALGASLLISVGLCGVLAEIKEKKYMCQMQKET